MFSVNYPPQVAQMSSSKRGRRQDPGSIASAPNPSSRTQQTAPTVRTKRQKEEDSDAPSPLETRRPDRVGPDSPQAFRHHQKTPRVARQSIAKFTTHQPKTNGLSGDSAMKSLISPAAQPPMMPSPASSHGTLMHSMNVPIQCAIPTFQLGRLSDLRLNAAPPERLRTQPDADEYKGPMRLENELRKARQYGHVLTCHAQGDASCLELGNPTLAVGRRKTLQPVRNLA